MLRFGKEMAFVGGLCAAAGVGAQCETLDLSNGAIGGDKKTPFAAVAEIVKGIGSLTSLDMSNNNRTREAGMNMIGKSRLLVNSRIHPHPRPPRMKRSQENSRH